MPTTSAKINTKKADQKSDQQTLIDQKFEKYFEKEAAKAKILLERNPIPPELLRRNTK